MGAVRLPKILVLAIDGFLTAQDDDDDVDDDATQAPKTKWKTLVSDLPCNIRRGRGQSLVTGGPSLVISEGKACNPL